MTKPGDKIAVQRRTKIPGYVPYHERSHRLSRQSLCERTGPEHGDVSGKAKNARDGLKWLSFNERDAYQIGTSKVENLDDARSIEGNGPTIKRGKSIIFDNMLKTRH